MNRISDLHNQKNTAVLSAAVMARIRQRSRPQEVDRTAELEHTNALAKHTRAMQVTSTGAKSSVNERKARMGRLQKLAEEHEAELQKLDEQERQIRKAEREEQLKRAEWIAFQQKPEIRAINAQLMLTEAVKGRQRQILMNERKKQIEQEREEAWLESEKARWAAEEERERELARQRRQKAIEVAEGFKKQRMEVEELKMQRKQDEADEEQLLATEAKRLLEEETLAEIRKKEQTMKNLKDAMECNNTLIAWKNKMKQLEAIDDARVREEKWRLDEERDARELADKKRREDKQNALEGLIKRQQQNLEEIKARQQQFDASQYELQYEKDRKQMEELRLKQERLREERRQDFLEAQRKIEAKKKMAKLKQVYPPDEATTRAEEASWALEAQRAQGRKELAEFQKQQALEKREREAAEKERRKLEFQQQLELDAEKSLEAQQYAREMLLAARKQRMRKEPCSSLLARVV